LAAREYVSFQDTQTEGGTHIMNSHRQSPPKHLAYLLQLFWRWATPFWLFRDANNGSVEQRITNYRYNRSRRGILPGYALKWIGIAACMMLLLQAYSGLMIITNEGTVGHFCATLFCVSAGIGFSFSCVVIAILMTSYLFFSSIEK
jgi:hypothetical protein